MRSVAVVAFGQGGIGCAAGWLCAASPPHLLFDSPDGLLGMAATILLTTGFYPLSQLYQIAEDRARGDFTFSVVYGPVASFRFSLGCLIAGGMCVPAVAWRRFGAVYGTIGLVGRNPGLCQPASGVKVRADARLAQPVKAKAVEAVN